ncbi:MAG TPA: hypothetical protein VND15_00130 [Candidatus Acidoferrales bacterium]|nr:hypothetical protein [Candidatus Acidoferrales bacterium]
MKKSASERELSRGMDSMIGEVQAAYGAKLEEEAQIERKLSDVALRDDVIAMASEVVRLRKLAERFGDEEALNVSYTVVTDVYADRIAFRSVVRRADQA